MKKLLIITLFTLILTGAGHAGSKENAERVAALKFYGIECGQLTSKGKSMLNSQQGSMDQSTYRATQRNLSDLVLVHGIYKTCDMILDVLKPQGLAQ